MIDQSALDEIFPNNPLREVAFEIRFPMNLRVLRDVYEVQQFLRNEYSVVNREETITPTDPTTISYHFTDPNHKKTIKLNEDRLAIIHGGYESFEVFKTDILSKSNWFCDFFRLEQFLRVGLRYINQIPIVLEDGPGLLSKVVNPYIDLNRIGNNKVIQFGTHVLIQKERCAVQIRNALLPQSPQHSFYILDLDAFTEGQGNVKHLGETLEILHHTIQVEFLTHVTEGFKSQMRKQK